MEVLLSSVVIRNLNLKCVSVFPAETDPVLIVNSDAVPPRPVSFQRFEPVGGRRRQVAQFFSAIDLHQPPKRDPRDPLEDPHAPLLKDRFCIFVAERSDHTTIIQRIPLNVRRVPRTVDFG
jgi:hypothetical protein